MTFADRKGGFPHSEIFGSKGARASPKLIAACHVLHRLSTPRHPSEALMRLIVLSKTHAWGRCRPRYETRPAPTHALCLCQTMMSSKVAPPNACAPGQPSIHNVTSDRLLPKGRKTLLSDRVASLKVSVWWSQTGSNRRPHACKARALPTELWPLPEAGPGEPSSTWPPPRRHRSVVHTKCGGPRQTRTADLTLIRRVL